MPEVETEARERRRKPGQRKAARRKAPPGRRNAADLPEADDEADVEIGQGESEEGT